MKKLIYILGILMLLPAWLTAQTPSTFNYQAVIQNKEGNVARNQQASLQLDIIQGSESGFVIYSETRNVTTNSFGLINISIGSTSPEDFAAIDWSQGPYYIGTTVNGEYLGASLLQSVPYAIQAHSVINDMVNDEDSDPTIVLRGGPFSWLYRKLTQSHIYGHPSQSCFYIKRAYPHY